MELLELDELASLPVWANRGQIAQYGLRYLSLMGNLLDGAPLGIDLGALPRLTSLILAENALVKVPPVVGSCASHAHLDPARNPTLHELAADDLPEALRWLEVSRTALAPRSIESSKAARPDLHIVSH